MMNETSTVASEAGPHDKLLQAYEEIAYVGAPNPNSHPERLGVVASLLGIDVARPSKARVLEIGCGDGANVIPMAAAAPDARFVAFDFAPSGIAKGRAMVEALGLRNIELRVLDIRDLPEDLGQFDYVIAHGVYSWVPDDVRAVTLP